MGATAEFFQELAAAPPPVDEIREHYWQIHGVAFAEEFIQIRTISVAQSLTCTRDGEFRHA